MASSPAQRSLALLKSEGWLCEITERWIPGARIRKDLFGFGDILAIRGADRLIVQTTSASCMSSRRKKIADHENVGPVRAAGFGIELHGWRKNAKGRWVCNREDLS